jgi:hypothetical protein
MREALLVSIFFCILPICWTPQVIAAEIQGTVTARKNGALRVTFAADQTSCPQKGDRVDFSLFLQGIEVDAGIGKVAEAGADFAWVDHLTGNADLHHLALIHATGQPTQTAPPAPKPLAPGTLAETETGWGDGGYQQISPEERHISGITAAHQSCDYPRALQLAELARAEIPANPWLQQNYATLEILARRSINYRKALNGAYQALENGLVNESIGLLKQAMQNASLPCGQDQQVLSLLEQAKLIAQMERDEAIEQARRRSIANARDSESYRVAIEKKRAEREVIGDLLTGNLLGLLGAFSTKETANFPKAEPHSDQEMVQKLVGEAERDNSEVLNKWRQSQGWSTNPAGTAKQPTNTIAPTATTQPDLVRDLVDKSEQENSEILHKWRQSQGWE